MEVESEVPPTIFYGEVKNTLSHLCGISWSSIFISVVTENVHFKGAFVILFMKNDSYNQHVFL